MSTSATLPGVERALDYARKGYSVHPLCWPTPAGQCGCGRNHRDNEVGKAPLAPHGCADATRDEATIRAWWNRWPNANVGFNARKTGIVDVAPDCPEWARTFAERGMPRTTLYRSGGGAGHWHALYRLPNGVPAHNINKIGEYDILAAGNTVAPGSLHRSGCAYTLRTDLLPVEDLPEAPAWVVELLRDAEQASAKTDDLDLALVEKRRGNIAVILARVLRTLPKMAREALEHPDRCRSNSEARYHVIGGLMHLPNEEIAALIFHWCDTGKMSWGHLDGKSLRQKLGDIERVIGKHEARMAERGKPRTISPTRGAGLLSAQPLTKARARSDRPQRLTAAGLFAYYKQEAHSGVVLMTQAEIAQVHGVSTRTIIRLEQKLGEQIERVAKQHTSFVRIRASCDNIAALSYLAIADIVTPSADESDQSALYNHASPAEQDGEAEAGADAAQPGDDLSHLKTARPLLMPLVRACFDQCGVLNHATGEIQRLSLRRVMAFVRHYGTWTDAAIRRVYTDEQRERRAALWRKERTEVRAMDDEQLIDAIKKRQASVARNAGKRLEGKWRTRLAIADEERQRRGLVMPDNGKRAVTPQKRRPRRADKESVPVQTALELLPAFWPSTTVGDAPAPARVSTPPARGTAPEGAVLTEPTDLAPEIRPPPAGTFDSLLASIRHYHAGRDQCQIVGVQRDDQAPRWHDQSGASVKV